MALNIIAVIVLLFVCGHQAATVTWTCATGEWSTTTCWDTGALPAAGDTVDISSGNSLSITTAGITIESIQLNTGSVLSVSVEITVYRVYNYYGTVIVLQTGILTPVNDTATVYEYYGTYNISGTVKGKITNDYGTVNVLSDAVINQIENSNDLNIEANTKITWIKNDGDVTFHPTGDKSIEIESFEADGGNVYFVNSVVNVTKNYNVTYDTDHYGDGWLSLGVDTIQYWYYAYFYEKVVVYNWGKVETDPSTSSYVFILDGSSAFHNYGVLVLDSSVRFDSVDSELVNEDGGEITSNEGASTDSDACQFYNYYSSSGTQRANLTNAEGGNITCPVFRPYYINVKNEGNLLSEEIYMSGGDSVVLSISKDQERLQFTGYGTIHILGNVLIKSLITPSGSFNIINEGGNTTVESYNSSASNTWTSGDADSWFIFAQEYTTDYYEIFDGAWVIFEDDSNQTSSAYFQFTNSNLWARGHFILENYGTWNWYDESNFTNQGLFEVKSYFSLYQYTSTTGYGQFISVGVVKYWDYQTIGIQYGICNGGLLVVADESDTDFSTYISLTDRFAIDGEIEIEVSPKLTKKYFENFVLTLISYYSASGKYSEDYNEDGIPITIKTSDDYDVKVRKADDPTIDLPDFSDLDRCFGTTGLYINGKDYKNVLCLDEPSDYSKGLCDQDFPPATVEIENPATTDAASTMIFSVLSVFIIAAFITLF